MTRETSSNVQVNQAAGHVTAAITATAAAELAETAAVVRIDLAGQAFESSSAVVIVGDQLFLAHRAGIMG